MRSTFRAFAPPALPSFALLRMTEDLVPDGTVVAAESLAALAPPSPAAVFANARATVQALAVAGAPSQRAARRAQRASHGQDAAGTVVTEGMDSGQAGSAQQASDIGRHSDEVATSPGELGRRLPDSSRCIVPKLRLSTVCLHSSSHTASRLRKYGPDIDLPHLIRSNAGSRARRWHAPISSGRPVSDAVGCLGNRFAFPL